MRNPYNVDYVKLDAAGRKVMRGFKGALSFRTALSGGTRHPDNRFEGSAVVADALVWVEIGNNGPIPLYPGESVRSLDGEEMTVSWFAQAGVTAVLLKADPERFEADLRQRAL